MDKALVLQKMLQRINHDDKVDSSNIVEKIKDELQQHDINMYNSWEKSGFNINANSFGGSNLLCLASENGHVKVVELLIEKDANVNVQDNEGKTPLHLAVSSSSSDMIGVPIAIRGLIESENVNVQGSIADVLIGKGANVNIQDNEGKTPLHLAVSNLDFPNLFAVVSLIIGGAEVNIQDNEGKTPLHLAISNSEFPNFSIIENLIEVGAEVNIQDNEGKTPLDYAISSEREDIIKILTGKVLLSDEGLTSQMSSEQEVEIDSQDQYETLPSYPFFF